MAIEEIAFIATFVALHYFSGATTVRTDGAQKSCKYLLTAPAFDIDEFSPAFNIVLEWSCAELDKANEDSPEGVITFRN